MKNLKLALSALVLVASASVASAGTVYMGTDPSYHFPAHPGAVTLLGNSIRWAGSEFDPTIAYTTDTPGFGADPTGILAANGFTSVTGFLTTDLATTDLSPYRVLYIAPTTSVAGLVAASANIAAFVAAGGGLVVEAQVLDALSWSWVPDAALIGHSGSINVGTEEVVIDAPGHAVMAGLTAADLDFWSISVHSTFATPGLAGYTTLASQADGLPYIIAKGGLVAPLPSASVMGFGLMGAAGLVAFRRRRRAQRSL